MCVSTTLSLVPKNTLMRRCCLIHLKNSSTWRLTINDRSRRQRSSDCRTRPAAPSLERSSGLTACAPVPGRKHPDQRARNDKPNGSTWLHATCDAALFWMAYSEAVSLTYTRSGTPNEPNPGLPSPAGRPTLGCRPRVGFSEGAELHRSIPSKQRQPILPICRTLPVP